MWTTRRHCCGTTRISWSSYEPIPANNNRFICEQWEGGFDILNNLYNQSNSINAKYHLTAGKKYTRTYIPSFPFRPLVNEISVLGFVIGFTIEARHTTLYESQKPWCTTACHNLVAVVTTLLDVLIELKYGIVC